MHAPRNQVMNVKLQVNVVARSSTTNNTSKSIPLEHFHAKLSVWCSTLNGAVRKIVCSKITKAADVGAAVVYALYWLDYPRQPQVSGPFFN